MKRLINLFLITILGFTSTGQELSKSSDLFSILEKELFPSNMELINIDEIVECRNQIKGEIYQIRKNQPNVQAVLRILQSISLERENDDIESLTRIYEKHIRYFEKEWNPVFENVFYVCGYAKEQMKILEGFESALHALYIKGLDWSPATIYEYHKKQIFLDYAYLHNFSKRNEIINEKKIFNPLYKERKKNVWFAFRVNFSYITPFINEIQEFVISDFEEFQWDSLRMDEDYKFNQFFIKNNLAAIFELDNPKVHKSVSTNFDNWLAYNQEGFFYKRFGESNNLNLLDLLLNNLVRNPLLIKKNPNGLDYYFRLLLQSPNNRNYAEHFLLNELYENNLQALSYIRYFPSENLLKKMNQLFEKKVLNIKEKKILRDVLITILHQNKFDKELKEKHQVLLEKINEEFD